MTKNIIANFIGRFWSILSNFLFIPLYIHYLGFESFSIISFTLVIAGLMTVLDAGLTATLSREFARKDNTHEEKIRIFRTLEASYLIVIGLCIIIIYSLSGIIADNWLNLKTFDPERVSFFLKIISADVGFQLLLRFYMGGLLGLEKQVKANMYQMGWGILRNGLVVLGLLLVPTLEMFFIWQTISTVVFALLFKLALNGILTARYRFDFSLKIESSVLKRIWGFASGMLLISLVAGLNTQMDKIAISKLLPVESLGHYTLAFSLTVGIIVVVSPISIALLPRFTALYSDGETDKASKLFNKINLFVAILVFSIMANMSFFPKELIWIWTGNMELATQTRIYIPVLAFSAAMLSLQIIPFNIAIANGYTKLNNILGVVSLFITLPGYWFATKNYGAIGAAWVYCVVQFLITLIYLYIINNKFIKVKSVSVLYVGQMLFPLLLSLAVAFGFSFIPDWAKNSRIVSLVWIGMATFFTICVSVLFLVPKAEKRKAINLMLQFKNKIR
jgi:O-antigen/teichoic acid export membrane protein